MHLSLFLNTGGPLHWGFPLVVGEKYGAPLMAPDHILCCVGGAVQAVDASVVAGGSANNFEVTEIYGWRPQLICLVVSIPTIVRLDHPQFFWENENVPVTTTQ